MGLFVARYAVSLLIFVIGLKAPAIFIARDDEYQNMVENDENASTWRNTFKKVRTLLPFLWPKKSFFLQFRVVICIILVILGRVINVYVPIYNKNIGKFYMDFNV